MVTITEDYVSSEIAELLREKGFPQSTLVCNTVYKPNGCISNNAKSFISPCYIGKDIYVFAPTLQMAMKWLREKYNLFIEIQCYGCGADEEAHFEFSFVVSEFMQFDNKICR